jgi:hypothetical protein
MSKVPFVHSGYERKENDDYQTVDKRCVQALIQSTSVGGKMIDICGSHGSSIVNILLQEGFGYAYAAPEAFVKHEGFDWIVTNPPYDRRVVDKYIEHSLAHIQKNLVYGAAFLMRANWDFASSRTKFFDHGLYAGQIRMRFRPWWTEERTAQPIHNYVWHIWSCNVCEEGPIIKYWPTANIKESTKFEFQVK